MLLKIKLPVEDNNTYNVLRMFIVAPAFHTRLCCSGAFLCLDGAQNGAIDRCAL